MINRRIRAFNEQRGLIYSYDKDKEVEMLEEEIQELKDAKTKEDEVDAYCDIIVFASGALMKLGYEVDDVMDETLKEIESRKQDPIQVSEWRLRGSSGEKWKKDKNQNIHTLYKANYTKD